MVLVILSKLMGLKILNSPSVSLGLVFLHGDGPKHTANVVKSYFKRETADKTLSRMD